MAKCKAVHKNFNKYDVYIGRGGMWGNYAFEEGMTRSQAIAAYEKYLLADELLMAQLPTLIGKRLGCYCRREDDPTKSKPCHGDIIAKYVNRLGNPFFKSFTKRIMGLHRKHFPNSGVTIP
ncbi:DUF4326 domain-containing protein [Vibrio phage VAP7]|uniref:DUF4326 domain-containing protein n=2 Tax=Vapseptimavirus VAP7 TaxID=2841303 RepID=A0A4Y5TV38_9CAUD|nr:DUF4326 domain-containing protein [Vibrio phage VAP7]AWY10099.1 hypothetical protein [Vibrio phage VP-1]QDB73223.1 DUF4326 domain-containing protein [Vibrio phage VAP7]UFD98092.1 hypothetical protein [Vibrio phage BX-1]